MLMNPDELRRWAETEAEDCLRYKPPLPPDQIRRIIADHIQDAYSRGFNDATKTQRGTHEPKAALYLVTYDIAVDRKDGYQSLLKKLADMGAIEILDSVWILNHPNSQMARPIATDLEGHLPTPGDRLLVIEVGKDAGCTDLLDMKANDLLPWISQARF